MELQRKEVFLSPTKNRSSMRVIKIDYFTIRELKKQTENLQEDCLLFIDKDTRVHNAQINKHLKQLCEISGVPIITLHCLRHTHASLLLFPSNIHCKC